MYWLFLLLALGAFVLAISTTQTWLLAVSLLASLLFFLLWIKGLYTARFGGVAGQAPRALHPAELQALRQQVKPAEPSSTSTTQTEPPKP